jgi:hypothetical protein
VTKNMSAILIRLTERQKINHNNNIQEDLGVD